MFAPQFSPLIGGAERQAEKLARALALRGADVQLWTPRLDPDSPDREDFGGVQIVRFPISDLSRRFRDRLVRERISRILNSLNRSWAPLFFLHLQRQTGALNVAYQDGLAQFARATAGEALFGSSVAEIPVLVRRIMERVTSFYMLTIVTPKELEGRTRLRLESTQPGIRLFHRDHIEVSAKQSKGKT